MKRLIITATFLVAALGLRAQDCEKIVLPFYNGNTERVAELPAEKLEYRCRYARSAFYVADEVPVATDNYTVVIRQLSEVKDKVSGVALDENLVVDLESLNYYSYTFRDLQLSYPRGNVVLCFPTPASEHSYLVLRSLYEIHDRAEHPELFKE